MSKAKNTPAPTCECGCGETVTGFDWRGWKRFLPGHHAKLQGTGSRAIRWKGGVVRHKGYVMIFRPDHPRASSSGYVNRSWLVAEAMLGRPLRAGEIVHHKNQDRGDDRPSNLEVLESQSAHIRHHNIGSRRPRKLTVEQVREIRPLIGTMSEAAIGRRYGVDHSTIRAIRLGKTFQYA